MENINLEKTARKTALLGLIMVASLSAGVAYVIEKYTPLNSKAQLQARQKLESRKAKLDSLVELFLKKAELEDGQRGMSLHDMATMASELGYKGIIYEGQSLRLYTSEGGFLPRHVDIYLQIAQEHHLDEPIKIDDEKIMAYLKED